MNGNPDSLPPQSLLYQIVATRIDDQDGQALRARLGQKPFLIGSGKTANLLLDNPQILPVQVRLLASTTGQVLLTNLGEPEHVLMGAEPVATHVPTYWKPGVAVLVADFELQLVTLVEEEGSDYLERIRPAIITQASEVAPESGVDFVIDWGGDQKEEPVPGVEAPDEHTVLFPKNQTKPEDDEALVDTREGWRIESGSPENVAEHPPPDLPELRPVIDPPEPVVPEIPRLDESASLPTEAMPTELNRVLREQSPYVEIPGGNETLPKNWQSAGALSAQLPNDWVNLVAGERVRIPVSVRNESANPMQLRVQIAGLPNGWTVTLDRAAQLMPGDIQSVDVILETKAPFEQAYLEALLRMHDQFAPETYLTLPLRLNFKTAPNIVGRLSPTQLRANQTTYLNLHNHTQATITTFIAGHSDSPDLHVISAQAQLDLLPGQNIEIPVNLQVLRRPLFRTSHHRFSVSVRHVNRAALDYAGVAHAAPRLPVRILLLAALLIALALAWRILGNNAGAIAVGTPAVTATIPAMVEATSEPSADVEAASPEADTTSDVIVASPVVVRSTVTPRVRASATTAATTVPSSTSVPPTNTTSPMPTNTQTPSATPQPTVMLAVTDILPTPATPPVPAVFDDPRAAGCTVPIPDGWQPYTVQAGDRVFRLAVDSGTTVEEVARVNCLADARLLQVGQVLLLPAQ
jgi:LysM repeat protein